MKKGNIALSDYLDRLQAQGRCSFLRSEAMSELGMDYMPFHQAAHKLIKKGKLHRVKGEFYVLVPAEYATQGTPPVEWFIGALMSYLQQDYYIALFSAAAIHGATHQLTSTFQVITDKVMPEIIVGKVPIEFFYKKLIKPGYYQKVKAKGKMVNVAIPEITASDLLHYKKIGSIHFIATVLSEMGEKLDQVKLALLFEEGDIQTAIAQRLGYLLETLTVQIDLTPVYNVLKTKDPQYHLLVTNNKNSVIEKNKRWHILVNEIVEPDDL
jgi:predicted transcriptional regulator of viral defense system